MADKKISQLSSASTPLAGTEVLPILQSGSTMSVSAENITAGRAVSAASMTVSSGNVAFSSTGQRITGDMSSATIANRLAFQTSTANSNSSVTAIPNGTAVGASFSVINNSTPTNASLGGVTINSTEVRFQSAITGTGTYLPMTFYTNGAERARFSSAGGFSVGTTTDPGAGKLTAANGIVSTRVNPRVSSTTSTASITPDISAFDQYCVTAQAATLAINAPTGTPVDGNRLTFRILDDGTSRTLNWDATFTAIGVTIPTSTTINKTTYVGCVYNASATRWDVVAVTTQA